MAHRRLEELREAAAGCRACDLWKNATQTVFGEGPSDARVMLIGEQPGDREDRDGAPFVGPAGALLDRALVLAKLDRSTVYVTNAVKHFKWTPRGKRRLHSKPNQGEVHACHPWLEAEIQALHPSVIVCLGATAAQSLLGSAFRITKSRGVPLDGPNGARIVATIHPSSILRAPDHDAREEAFEGFVADLSRAAALQRKER